MMFDAFGRFSFGQISQPATSTAVLVGDPGAYVITGVAAAFKSLQPAAGGAYVITGNAIAFRDLLLASAGSYAITGHAALFADRMPAAAGSYAIAAQAAGGKSNFAAAAGAYAITGGAVPLTPSLLAVSGAYALTGGSSFLPGTMRADGGAYVVTLGQYELHRSGGEYDQVYGGIGHYLEEIEKARQLARITRKTPAPIVHEIGPRIRPRLSVQPIAPQPQPQAAERQTVTPQHLEQPAEQARIMKRRRQEIEILLLAS